jgi:hypothetical protein
MSYFNNSAVLTGATITGLTSTTITTTNLNSTVTITRTVGIYNRHGWNLILETQHFNNISGTSTLSAYN